jgi:hypothetical protein
LESKGKKDSSIGQKKIKNSCLLKNFLWYLSTDFWLKQTMAVSKKKVIKSLDTLPEDLKELLKEQYPNGYESSITRITNAKKEPIFVFPLETDDATYLVKVPATKNSDGGYDVESDARQEFDSESDDEGAADPADAAYSAGDDDYDEEGGSKGTREASYDPDFDS